MLSSLWKEFLEYAEKPEHKNTVILSLLKQVRPGQMDDKKLVLLCDNAGVRIYLEKRRPLIEKMLANHLKTNLEIEFVIEEKKHKSEPPLLTFQPSSEDLFARAGLNPKHTFDNYAVSSTNQVAVAASQAVAQNPGTSYNPLFIYGGVGVGKTHLSQAVAHYILLQSPETRAFFCPGDQFTNELIESIREHSTARFRRKYRGLKLLIIDDIQFIAGKQTVQEEFFHTFNAVVSAGGQIILNSDRPPTEIKNLEDRLRSRFSGGLIVDINQPDFELRTAILLIKAKEKNITIQMEAAKIIAEQITDVRALEGTLLTLYAKTLGVKDSIDLEVVDSFFQDKATVRIQKITSADVIKQVCLAYNIKQSHIKSATRAETIALPRQIVMYLLREELKLKFEEIARVLHRRDHTTIMHGVEKISRLCIKDPLLKQEIDKIIQRLRATT